MLPPCCQLVAIHTRYLLPLCCHLLPSTLVTCYQPVADPLQGRGTQRAAHGRVERSRLRVPTTAKGANHEPSSARGPPISSHADVNDDDYDDDDDGDCDDDDADGCDDDDGDAVGVHGADDSDCGGGDW